MTKMGRYNKITSEEFHKIKATIAEGKSDEEVKEIYHIKTTTLNYIKRCVTYYEYYLRTEGIPAARKMPEVELPNCRLKLIDYPPKKTKDKVREKVREKVEDVCPPCKDDFYLALWHFLIIVVCALIIVGSVLCVAIIKLITGN